MTPVRALEGVHRFEWESVIRRVQMPPTTKAIALLLATYSDTATGESIRPGHARLAAVSCASVSTVERGIKTLRTLGLIEELTPGRSRGRGGGGLAAVYRLTLPSDLLDAVEMLDVDEKSIASRAADNNDQSPTPDDSRNDPSPMPDESAENDPYLHPNHPSFGKESSVIWAESSVTHDDPPTHLTPTHLTPTHESPNATLTSARDVKNRGKKERNVREIESMVLGRDGTDELSTEQERQRQMRALEAMMKKTQNGVTVR